MNLASEASTYRIGSWGALVAAVGILFSGPLCLAFVTRYCPQPQWQDPVVFVQHYDELQNLPYYFGFLIIMGFVIVSSALVITAEPQHRVFAVCGLVCTVVFAALISLNYVVQTTFVPGLVRQFDPSSAATISAFTMANPASLGWSLEMWGYGYLGAATWFSAPTLRRNRLERITAVLFVLNGCVSVLGAVLTALYSGWVLTAGGIAAYAVWNALVFAATLLAFLSLRRRARHLQALTN